MERNVIIACSAQKKEQEGPRPTWKEGVSVSKWTDLIRSQDGQFRPVELYTGHQFTQQKKLVLGNSDRLWIASAGMGLLDGGSKSKDLVNHYDAAFTGGFGASKDVWSRLLFGGLERLIGCSGEIVISLPIPYQEAIISDHNFEYVSDRIVALGPGPLRNQPNTRGTPYHPRMIEIFGGQKLALFTHLLHSFYEDPINFSDLFALKGQAEKLAPPPTRTKIQSDEELIQILKNLPNTVTSGSSSVRYIRDILNRSCSQERILSAWRNIKHERR